MSELKNIPASIRARLFAHAKAAGEDFQRTLTRYGIERFLFRLSQHPKRDTFILKGAMLFLTWPEGAYRPTGDLDLLGRGQPDPETLKQLAAEIFAIPCDEDGLVFDATTIMAEPIREEDKYQGVRITGRTSLERAVVHLQIDIGFGDAVYPAPRKITFPCLLPALPMPEILAYPAETVIAEKFEAMVQLGEANSRMKDFNDLWAIMKTFDFEMAALVEAMTGTFARRGTPLPTIVPLALTAAFAAIPAKQAGWASFLKRNPPAPAPPPLEDLLAELRQFIGPVLAASANPNTARGRWDPTAGWA